MSVSKPQATPRALSEATPAVRSGQQPLANPFQVAGVIHRHRALLLQLVRRDIAARFKGSLLGVAWIVINPLIMLAVYSFVFREVLKVRWGEGSSDAEFVLVLFTGLIVFNFLSECLLRAPGVLLENVTFIKKVVFPLEILPVVVVATAAVNFLVGLATLLLFQWVLTGGVPWTALLIVPVILPQAVFLVGLSWFLASLGVFLRDLKQFVSGLSLVLMFLSPIFFPLTAIPADLRPIYLANPMTAVIEQARAVLLEGALPDWGLLGLLALGGWCAAWLALLWFRRTQRGFADVV